MMCVLISLSLLPLSLSLPPLSLQIMIEAEEGEGGGGKEEGAEAILTHQANLAVCTILKLLRTLAIDGFR